VLAHRVHTFSLSPPPPPHPRSLPVFNSLPPFPPGLVGLVCVLMFVFVSPSSPVTLGTSPCAARPRSNCYWYGTRSCKPCVMHSPCDHPVPLLVLMGTSFSLSAFPLCSLALLHNSLHIRCTPPPTWWQHPFLKTASTKEDFSAFASRILRGRGKR
jgi:hypothetical protein